MMISLRLGALVTTPGAADAIEENGQTHFEFLARHAAGDWGDLCDEDKAANDEALKTQGRLLSAYHLRDGRKLWVVTEWDRSVTTFLLPSEY